MRGPAVGPEEGDGRGWSEGRLDGRFLLAERLRLAETLLFSKAKANKNKLNLGWHLARYRHRCIGIGLVGGPARQVVCVCLFCQARVTPNTASRISDSSPCEPSPIASHVVGSIDFCGDKFCHVVLDRKITHNHISPFQMDLKFSLGGWGFVEMFVAIFQGLGAR